MSVPAKLDPDRAALLVIDVQEAFAKALARFEEVADRAAVLVQGAQAVGIPILATEQYPKGLGRTVSQVAEHLPEGARPIEKVCFSATEAEGFVLGERDQALVCGIETHVCVNQTVLDLLAQGREVHVARDATGSRSEEDWELGLHKMEQAGAVTTSVETALFELVRRAGTEQFKQVQALVK